MELVEEEIVALKRFRGIIADLLPQMDGYQSHDMTLIRFLRARELDLEEAATMIRKHWDWRTNNDIDNLLKIKLPQELETNFPVKVCGFAKDGYPVVLGNCGMWDFRQAMEAGMKEDFIKYIEQFFEQATKFCEHFSTNEKFISQAYIVLDATGFSPRQLASRDVISAVVQLIRIFESNYPELLRVGIVINVPIVFLTMWNLVKNLLTQRTISKIRILGGKNEWSPQIFQLIDADNWPAELGGAINTCVDYKLSYGFDVFPKYEVFPDDEFRTVSVLAGRKHPVELVLEEGWTLSWNFRTTDQCDIGFSVDFEDTQPLVKNCRVDAHLHLQKGIILCKATGRYTLTFDNSYSSFRAKTVSYAIRTTQSQSPPTTTPLEN